MTKDVFGDIWEVVNGSVLRMLVDVSASNFDDDNSHVLVCNHVRMFLEVFSDIVDNFHDFPWSQTLGTVLLWFLHSVFLHNLGDLLVDGNHGYLPGPRSANNFRDMSKEVLDDVWQVVLWFVFRMQVNVFSDDPDDGNSHRRRRLPGFPSEIPLNPLNNFDNFPLLDPLGCVSSGFRHLVSLDDLDDFREFLHNGK